MNSSVVIRTTQVLVVVLIVVVGFGSSVLYLWNWLVPGIFGLRAINYWEALGLMGLSWILFGGLRGFGRPPRREIRREHLTAEERERLRKGLEAIGGKCSQSR